MPLWSELVALLIATGDGFSGWGTLNDTVMGGRSQGGCRTTSEGLLLEAEVVAEGGGFVSCRSPRWQPPLDLGNAQGFELLLDGDGRRYKLAIALADLPGRLAEVLPGGLRWVADFDTQAGGTTRVVIPFSSLQPTVRANPVTLPLRFDPSRIAQIQLLHSRFSDGGGDNPGFRAGPLRLLLRQINTVP
ncbi:MAG: CIA30 family protein [Cyanobacteriota bacterium]|nr:CIA30 family protein [Cyanobacteriota bacterium]